MTWSFAPPPDPWPERAEAANPPPWTGRPQGPPSGAVLSHLRLARSGQAEVYIAYVDAYPGGFELEIRATADVAFADLAREGDGHGPDVFGRHWPMVGEPQDMLPAQLLRVGVGFADARAATSISGHDRPVAGPVMDALRGGGRGRGNTSEFHQGYWVSPLPPAGPVTVVCEWPALGIPVTSQEIDGELILDAAARARSMFGDERRVEKDGQAWLLGTDAEVGWINDGTAVGREITCAIPPVFDTYCTLELPDRNDPGELARHERAVIELLVAQTAPQSWWLGYLDTGASDVVFPYAARTMMYYGYGYVLVQAGPEQALRWREEGFNTTLPDLMFPADRSWLLSTMWDDRWTSVGGPHGLVDAMMRDTILGPNARPAALGQDPTPPGHQAI